MYLIDTNVISEIRKGQRYDNNVAAWFDSVDGNALYLSVLVVGEIRQGVERLRSRDPDRARILGQWLADFLSAFEDKILPIDLKVADEWGRVSALGGLPEIDALLASTAKVHGLTLVTRNLKDVERTGVACLNPFDFK